MAEKPFKSTSYDPAQDITEAQDGFLIEQPSSLGVRKQNWILFSAVRAWILTFSEFAQMTYNKTAINTNKNNIASNKNEIDGHSIAINSNTGDINSNAGDINSNGNAINALEIKTPQSYKANDAVEFTGGVKTDNVILKQKVLSGTADGSGNLTINHNLTASKIRGISAVGYFSGIGRLFNLYVTASQFSQIRYSNTTVSLLGIPDYNGFAVHFTITYEA